MQVVWSGHVLQSAPLAHGSAPPVPLVVAPPPWPDDAECEAETVVAWPPTPPAVVVLLLPPALQAPIIATATAIPLSAQVFMCSPPRKWFSG
jgi:hypothetical protein